MNKSLFILIALSFLTVACNKQAAEEEVIRLDVKTETRNELSLPTEDAITPTQTATVTAPSTAPESTTATLSESSTTTITTVNSETVVVTPQIPQGPQTPPIVDVNFDDLRREVLLKERSEALENLKKTKNPSDKRKISQRYFSLFDYKILVPSDALNEIFESFNKFQKKEELENLEALLFSIDESSLSFLSAHITVENEPAYTSLLDKRFKLLINESLKKLANEEDFNFFEEWSMSLFKWKPRYLKKKNPMTLEELTEVTELLTLALKTKERSSKVTLDKKTEKIIKHMNDDLTKDDALNSEIEKVQKLLKEIL